MGTSNLTSLADAIQIQVGAIQQHLSATGQPEPTFDADTPDIDYSGIEDVRSRAIENITELLDLLSTPREILQVHNETDFISRHACDRFKVYDAIPVGSTRTYEQIAAELPTEIPVPTLRRLLRHAMTQRIFCEPRPGVVAHTSVFKLLTENSKVRDYYGTKCNEVWTAAPRTIDVLEKWPGSRDRGQSGYVLAHGRTIQETLDQDPIKMARYDNAMGAFAVDQTMGLQHVIHGFDWATLGKATVVDLGGGVGTVSKALAKAYPSLDFIVEDQTQVLSNAVVEDPDLESRIRFLPHNFFTPQPVKDADVYFIRRVMMEWPDEKAVEILQALRPALKTGARVVIQDAYLPEPGACQLWKARRFRSSNLLALAIANASQRELEDWSKLFEEADERFHFKGVRPIPDSDIVFIEAEWRG